MILKELAWPFATGIGMFSLLTIATIALQEAARFAIRYNLSAALFLKLFALACPQFIFLSIPMGVLLGTLIAVGRLSSDNEITALRAIGLSLYRALLPFLFMGVVLSGVTILGSEEIVPRCNSALSDMRSRIKSGAVHGASQQRVAIPIREGGQPRWFLVADSMQGPELFNVKLFYFDPRTADRDFYITAARAVWEGSDWTFFKLRQVQLKAGDEAVVLRAEKARVPGFSITPQSLGLRTKTTDDLNIVQLRNLIADLLGTGNNKLSDTEIRDFRTKLYFKYAIPLTPLIFIFVAFPLAIRPQRSSSTMGMGMALLIVLLYYIMYTMFQKLGATGVVPPPAAAWVPNLAMLGVGVALLHRKERS
jgi:lipopolysaccharide export system permease protein